MIQFTKKVAIWLHSLNQYCESTRRRKYNMSLLVIGFLEYTSEDHAAEMSLLACRCDRRPRGFCSQPTGHSRLVLCKGRVNPDILAAKS